VIAQIFSLAFKKKNLPWIIGGSLLGFLALKTIHIIYPSFNVSGDSMYPRAINGNMYNATISFDKPQIGGVYLLMQGDKRMVKRVAGGPGDTLVFNINSGMLVARNGESVEHTVNDKLSPYKISSDLPESKGAYFIVHPYNIAINGIKHVTFGPSMTAFAAQDEITKSYSDKLFMFKWLTDKKGHKRFFSAKLPEHPNLNAKYVEFTIPSGEYFVLSDNRVGSRDSRDYGFIPESKITHKVVF
jgi:signal peptidase I